MKTDAFKQALLLSAFCGLIAGCSRSEPKSAPAQQAPVTASQEDATLPLPSPQSLDFYIGTTVNAGALQTTLIKVLTGKHISSEFVEAEAAEGGTYVVVLLRIKNIGTTPISSFDMPKISLVDGRGNFYSYDVNATMAAGATLGDNSKALSDLNPDLSVTKVVAFEVSEKAFVPVVWALQIGDKITYNLTPPP